jgi:hypothetical protein
MHTKVARASAKIQLPRGRKSHASVQREPGEERTLEIIGIQM